MEDTQLKSSSERFIGIGQVLLSGFFFGFLGLFGKTAYEKGATPAEVLSLRFLLAGVLFLSALAIFRPARLRLSRNHILWSIVLGACGYAVFSYCYFRALTGLSVSLTVLLLYLYPVMVAAGAWIFLGEKIAKDRWLALPIAMAGLVLLVWGEFYVRNGVALGFGIASAVLYSVYILCSRRFLTRADALPSAGLMQVSAGVALCAFAWRDPQRLSYIVSEIWPTLLGLALVCSIFAMTLFLAGLQKLRSWEASILSTAEPVTSIAVAYLFLGERLSLSQGIGGALVIAAFILVSLPEKGRTRNG